MLLIYSPPPKSTQFHIKINDLQVSRGCYSTCTRYSRTTAKWGLTLPTRYDMLRAAYRLKHNKNEPVSFINICLSKPTGTCFYRHDSSLKK